jgi:hypothetical protein
LARDSFDRDLDVFIAPKYRPASPKISRSGHCSTLFGTYTLNPSDENIPGQHASDTRPHPEKRMR